MSARRSRRQPWSRAVAILTGSSVLAAGFAIVTAEPALAAVATRCLGSPQVLPLASGGTGNTYALDSNGSVWGWGSNYFGQIGNGSRTDAALPLNASGFNSLQAISAGNDHILVLRQDGTVWTWGDAQYGQQGDGTSGFDVMSPVPKQIPGIANVTAIAAGGDSSFVRKSDGTWWAWGRNDYAELGDGTTTNRPVPTQITALTGFTAVASSPTFTLGLKSDGTVWAWGFNDRLQLGANVAQWAYQTTPIQVPGISGVTAVAAGSGHSVALTSTGAVKSWGYAAEGQLGNNTFNDTSTPTQATGLTSGVTQISAGGFFTLALKSDGTARSWGQNLYGELGNPAGATYQGTPIQVSTITGVAALAGGGNDAAALTSSGAVWDWGMNHYGEVGNGYVNPDGSNPQRSPFQTSVVQAAPAVPTKLEAVAGNGLAYLTWNPPTSAMTQYVVTPYLNGVAQPEVAAPVGSATYTVSGLTQGANYTFTVKGQNCLGNGTATAQSNRVIPTGVQLNDPSAKSETSRLTDRMSLAVNTFTGNVSVVEHDVAIRGTGLDLAVDRTFNNLAATDSIFGHNWTLSGGTNVSLTILGDGSVFFNMPGGAQVGFAKNADGTYTPPSGIDATLVKNPDTSYTLSFHANGEKWQFTSAGVATSHADRNANTISFAYGGPGGAISSITDTQARVTTFAYNAQNLVSSVTDPGGRLYQYGYDAAKNLTTYTDPKNKVTTFAYNAGKDLTQITTPAGRVVGLYYDASHRLTSMTHPLQAGNPTTTYTYNATSTVVTDANSHTTTYTYDPVGRTTKVVDALGNATSAGYTSNSNVASYASGNGSASANFAYDNVNNLNVAAVQPGAHTTLGYTDPSHPYSPTTVTEPQNNTSTLSYDTNGNVITQTDPLPAQNQVQLTRNANGTVATSTDPKGSQTSYGYDVKGNLTSVTPPSPLGAESIVVDTLSRPTSITDGKGQTTAYTYDALDRVTNIAYAGGASVARVYDDDGNVTSTTDATGTITMTYDAMGRLTQRVAGAVSVSYGYDGVGNLTTLTDAGGTTTYGYNAINLPTTVTAPGLSAITLGYDAGYNRTSVAYPNGVTVYSVYDSANRLVDTHSVNAASQTLTSSVYGYRPSAPTTGSARAVTMRGSPSTFATNGTMTPAVTLATPTALVPGDVEVAQVSIAANATVTSVPTGWTQIRSDSTGATWNDLRQTLYYHVASATEPTSYSWGLSRAVEANGGLTAWTGVDTTAPVATSSGQTNATGTSYPTTVGTDSPAGYWRLSEASGATTAVDGSSNALNGTYGGGTTLAQTGALSGEAANKAVTFNGSTGYVWLGEPSALRPNSVSVEAWFKTSTTAQMSIMRSRWYGYNLGTDGAGKLTGNVCGTPSLNCYFVTSPASVANGAWHHAVLTKDGATVRLYLDGAQVASTSMFETTYYGSGGIAIGRDGDANGSYFNGSIDEVAVYPSALSASRVSAHYSAAPSAPTAPSWTAPSVSFTNGEADLAFYGGRLFGPTSALPVPANYTAAYDTQTNWISVGVASRTLGATTGATGAQTVAGPNARWVGQQVLLRPVYDTSLRQTTPAGTAVYDKVNRLTSLGGYTYTYDGAGNRLTELFGTQAVTSTANAPNQLTSSTRVIARIGGTTAAGIASPASPTFSVALPPGIAAGDQLLVSVTVTQPDSIAVAGYTPVVTATSGATPADAKTIVFRRTATGTGADTPVVTPSTGASAVAVLAAYRGVHPTSPIDTVAAGSGALTTTLTNPAVSASTIGEELVVFQGAIDNTPPGTWGAPPGTAEWLQQTDQPARSAGVADRALGAQTGSTGPLTSTIATTNNLPANLAGAALTLRPATTTYTYDANGNLTASSDGAVFAYDSADHTTSITPAGASTTTFVYRGSGQSERKSMSPATRVSAACADISGCPSATASLGATGTFVDSTLGVIAETDSGSTTYFVRDPRGGLLAERTPGGVPYYYLFDGQGSVIGLTNSSGTVAATYGYDPFGRLTSMASTGSVGINNPWRYVGAYQDGTGLYKMGARYYDPTVGRFTQQDPVVNALDPNSWNRYVYVGNDPINKTDPSGLCWPSWACGVEHAIGGAFSCAAHVVKGLFPLPPTAAGGLVDAGLLVFSAGVGIFTAAAAESYVLPASYVIVADVFIIVGAAAVIVGVVWLVTQC